MNDFEMLFLKWFFDKVLDQLKELRVAIDEGRKDPALILLGDIESDAQEMLDTVALMMEFRKKGE